MRSLDRTKIRAASSNLACLSFCYQSKFVGNPASAFAPEPAGAGSWELEDPGDPSRGVGSGAVSDSGALE